MGMNENRFSQNFDFSALMKFSVPTMIMMVFMSLYQTTDGVFISNLVGELGLTALNVVYPFSSVIIAIAVMFASGGSAIIGLNMGLGRNEEARENFSLIVLAGIVFSVVISVLSLIFMEPLIYFMGATPLIYQMCAEYLFIMILVAPLCVLQLLFQAFFVLAGKPKLGLFLTVLSGVANLVLDAVFMGPLQMGIGGAALATGIGYGITGIVGIFYFALCRTGSLYFVRPKLRMEVLKKACLNGSSEMVNNMAMAVTTLLFNVIGMHFLQEEGVAAISIVLYAQYVMTAVFMGYTNGVAPIFSYKYGADDRPQIQRLYRYSVVFVTALSVIVFLLAFVVAKPIAMVFASHSAYVLELSVHGFNLFAVSFLFTGLNIFTSGLFTAFSNGIISGGLSMLRTFVLLVIALIALPQLIGPDGIWLAVPVAEGIAVIFSLLAMVLYRKRYHFAER